ncbi:MAG TPA: efflux RND transporter periplasmic adaptor subunit [Ignavibacteriales bacterium]|nr:efflux RND transporter periplasmic adaptor subunit [Ignavibacteriales bacterium]
MKSIIKVFLLILAVMIAGCGSGEEKQTEQSVPVQIYKPAPSTIANTVALTGGVTAENDAVIYSKVSEKIDKIYVNPGDRVSAGQTLAVQANAALRSGVEVAQAAVKSAEALANLAAQEFARNERLFGQKAISQQQYDKASSEKASAQAAVEQAKASLAQAQEHYQDSFIKAPFAGVVGAVYVTEDQFVPAGQQVVQMAGSNSQMKAKLQASGMDYGRIKKGQNVRITFPTIPGETFSGFVYEIDKSVNPATNSLGVEIRFKDSDPRITSGVFGEFLIETDKKENTLVIPEDAVLTQTQVRLNQARGTQEAVKKYFAFVIENKHAKLKEINVGIVSDGSLEVVKGIAFNDSVVVVGQNIVKDGQLVNIVD